MKRRFVLFVSCAFIASLAAYIGIANATKKTGSPFVASASSKITQGSLQVLNSEGNATTECPLKHTNVKAEISGFLSRVTVTQEFQNPFKDKIEAIYTFPLPQNAAVDDMTMRVGERTVRGSIKRREEARAIYEAARQSGHVASLLDQERPNIFTQAVANITAGEKVIITISYVETLKYDNGSYEFAFPMVVGPRYIPGNATGKQAGGFAPDTDKVPDASRITPKPTLPATRAGHDISIDVTLDAGVPIDNIQSTLHQIDMEKTSAHSAAIKLRNRNEIPNKDFILKYDVAGGKIADALMTHRGQNGGYFSFILQPPERVTANDVTPKEIVFVLDTSGSMEGFPIEKAKECMKLALDNLYPQDTFNLITFAGDTHILFPEPVAATRENLQKAQAFLASRSGGGGTEMMKAIRAALDPSDKQEHIRIVCFMTDGYVGNDFEIISEVQKHPNARVFSFGIGGSVNRFLLDKMAEHGRGEVEYVTLQDDGSAAARRLHERIRNPLLTDISVDWNGLPVADVYPKRIPDLFSAKPVVLTGRYTGGTSGTIYLKGKLAGKDFVKEITVNLPEQEPQRDVLAKLWARTRIEDLMAQDYNGAQTGNMKEELRETVTQMGLDYRLMTQFTSFVAVEEMTITEGGTPRRVEVPVEMPEGVSRRGVFGEDTDEERADTKRLAMNARMMPTAPPMQSGGGGGTQEAVTIAPRPEAQKSTGGRGKGGGIGSGVGGGVGSDTGAGIGPGRGSSGKPTTEKDKNDGSLSPADRERAQTIAKLHPAVAAVVQRLKNKTQATAGEAKFVRNDKAEVQVFLADKTPETLAQLKKLGFEVIAEPKSARMLIGRIAIDKLEELAKLKAVTYVAPMSN